MRTFRDLINNWPTIASFARAIDVDYQLARRMVASDNIESHHWRRLLKAAHKRGVELTADELIRLSVRRKGRTKPAKRKARSAEQLAA